MIKSIVVGFDGSEASERALRMACEMSEKFGAALRLSHTPKDETVAYAAEAISSFYVGPNAARQEMLLEAAESVAVRAKELANQAGYKHIEVHIGHADPAEDVLALAKRVKADLIVTGRRGLGDLRGLIMGSTSHSISKGASCACMTVA
jgi:nucleotide-binding universal stress UspA family protein